MKIEQRQWTEEHGWTNTPSELGDKAQLVFAFGGSRAVTREDFFEYIRRVYPEARIVMCSTAGEILGTDILEESLVTTAVHFKKTPIECAAVSVKDNTPLAESAQALAAQLPRKNLKHVMVFSDGLNVNGSVLVQSLRATLPETIQVTGGLSADGDRFKKTHVGLDAPAAPCLIAAVGFYGSNIHIGFGSMGGWDPFGPDRVITKSEGNVLYELDGEPALKLYKEYLGDHASELPASALRFPLSVHCEKRKSQIVRTILGVDEENQSLIFAGDLPQGCYARLMKANFDRLIDGAEGAAHSSFDSLQGKQAELAILISCVGRRLVLQQRTEEELEAVREVLGEQAALTGFYSYGEICPSAPNANCELHNQTMTITTFRES